MCRWRMFVLGPVALIFAWGTVALFAGTAGAAQEVKVDAGKGTQPRIDLAPRDLVDDLHRLRAARADDEPEFVLIGRRELRTVNSWAHNLPSLVAGRTRCLLYMHPADAAARRIASGDRLRVTSRVGAVEVAVELTADVMPGVVCLPHGYGHKGDGLRLTVAAQHAGVSMNDLTDPAAIDPLSGNAVLSGTPVRLERCN